jgi:hypothetical protein
MVLEKYRCAAVCKARITLKTSGFGSLLLSTEDVLVPLSLPQWQKLVVNSFTLPLLSDCTTTESGREYLFCRSIGCLGVEKEYTKAETSDCARPMTQWYLKVWGSELKPHFGVGGYDAEDAEEIFQPMSLAPTAG